MLKNFRLYSLLLSLSLSLALSLALQQLFNIIYGFEFLPRYSREKKIDRSKASTSCITQYTCLRIFFGLKQCFSV